MSATLADLLPAQNPWWSSSGERAAAGYRVRRSDFDSVRERFLERAAPQLLLVGPRQVGKTVLLRQIVDSLLDEGIAPQRIVYFNFEDQRLPVPVPLVRDVVAAHAAAFPRRIEGPPLYLFDEIGKAPRWDVGLKDIHEAGVGRALATDSAALLLAGKRSVAGRFLEQRISFLSYSDFVRFRQASFGGASEGLAVAQVFDAYLQRGGLPAHVLTDDAALVHEAIRQAIETSLILDLTAVAGLRHPDRARALFAALAADSGTAFNASRRGEDVGVPRQTVNRWLDVLVETGLLARLTQRTKSTRARSRNMPKVYATDPGIVAAFSLASQPLGDDAARGRIIETVAHEHLAAAARRLQARLTYTQDGRTECDFVLESAEGAVVLEVTAGRATNGGDASKAARLARTIAGSVPAVASRHPLEHVHPGKVKEVPLWSLFDELGSARSLREVMKWLRS